MTLVYGVCAAEYASLILEVVPFRLRLTGTDLTPFICSLYLWYLLPRLNPSLYSLIFLWAISNFWQICLLFEGSFLRVTFCFVLKKFWSGACALSWLSGRGFSSVVFPINPKLMISLSFNSFCSAIKSCTTEVGRSNSSLSPIGILDSKHDLCCLLGFFYSACFCCIDFYFFVGFFWFGKSSVRSWAEYSSWMPTESMVILPVSPRSLLLFISKLAVTFFSVIIFFVAKRCWERWDSCDSWRSLLAFYWLMCA